MMKIKKTSTLSSSEFDKKLTNFVNSVQLDPSKLFDVNLIEDFPENPALASKTLLKVFIDAFNKRKEQIAKALNLGPNDDCPELDDLNKKCTKDIARFLQLNEKTLSAHLSNGHSKGGE